MINMNYKTLKDDYEKLIHIMNKHNNEKLINTQNETFLAPTTLIPLIHHVEKNNKQIKASNKTHDYILRVLEQKNTNSTTFLNDTNKCLMNLPLTEKNRKREESNLNFIKKINNIYGGQWFQTYIVEELTNNIYEHAYNENIDVGINYAQVYPQLNMMDLCIYDAGKSIPGSYTEHGTYYEDDCHAIELALSHNSTAKDSIPDDPIHQRGNGIRSVIKKVITENGGEVLLASRNGYLYINSRGEYEYNLGGVITGTLITLRLKPNRVPQIMNQSELQFSNPYVYKK